MQKATVEALRNPRADCQVYTGHDREDFRSWVTAFNQTYPENMEPKDRLLGLWKKTGGVAKELIADLPTSDDSFLVARERLEEKYGRPDQVIARINRNFKAESAVPNADDAKAFRALFNKIRSMVETYAQLDEPISGSFMIEIWLEKLPKQVARKWAKATLNDHKVVDEELDADGNVTRAGNGLTKKGGNVDAFLAVVDDEVRMSEKMATFVKPKQQQQQSSNKQQPQQQQGNKKPGGNSASLLAAQAGGAKPAVPLQDGAAAAAVMAAMDGKAPQQKKKKSKVTCNGCFKASAGHRMDKCGVFLKLDPKVRKAWAWELWRCKRCLEKGHKGDNCTAPVTCTANGCGYADRHHPLIHVDQP